MGMLQKLRRWCWRSRCRIECLAVQLERAHSAALGVFDDQTDGPCFLRIMDRFCEKGYLARQPRWILCRSRWAQCLDPGRENFAMRTEGRNRDHKAGCA